MSFSPFTFFFSFSKSVWRGWRNPLSEEESGFPSLEFGPKKRERGAILCRGQLGESHFGRGHAVASCIRKRGEPVGGIGNEFRHRGKHNILSAARDIDGHLHAKQNYREAILSRTIRRAFSSKPDSKREVSSGNPRFRVQKDRDKIKTDKVQRHDRVRVRVPGIFLGAFDGSSLLALSSVAFLAPEHGKILRARRICIHSSSVFLAEI